MEAVRSAQRSSVQPPRHLIVLDSSSPSRAAAVSRELVTAIPEVRETLSVQALPFKAGAGSARTIGLSLVETRFVTVLDADDTFPEGSLDLQLRQLSRHPTACWCVGTCRTVYPSTEA